MKSRHNVQRAFEMAANEFPSDHAFVAALRAAVEAYLAAVDQWEGVYQKYYRVPVNGKISSDLEGEQHAYEQRRRELEKLVPRARRLCLKYRLREPFSGLLRVSLGQYAPQERMDSAIGRSERSAVTACLVELSEACQDWELAAIEAPEPKPNKAPFLRRVIGFFY
jgi:hypothetical protein